MAKPLALTSGEPAGIGPDIAIAAWLRRSELELPPFYLLGDRDFFEDRARTLGLKVELADTTPEDAAGEFARALPVVATGQTATARPGAPDATSANAALASIRAAVDDVRAGKASAVVTNPIAKSVLYRAGFRHPGHISHSLITNPAFLIGLALLVLAPPPITFYGPVVFVSSPDWLWLLLGWIVAGAAAFLMYSAIRSEEAKLQ